MSGRDEQPLKSFSPTKGNSIAELERRFVQVMKRFGRPHGVLEKNANIIPTYKNNLAHESTILRYYLESMDKLGWRYSSKLGYKSSGCLIAKNDSTKMYGNVSSLVLPSIDLSKHKGSAPFRFSFRYAYKRPIPFMYEKLNIYASTDCGSSWRHISEVINWCTAGGT